MALDWARADILRDSILAVSTSSMSNKTDTGPGGRSLVARPQPRLRAISSLHFLR